MKRNLMTTAIMLLLSVATSFSQTLRSPKYFERKNDTVKFVNKYRFGKPKPTPVYKPDGKQHWKLGLITKAGGDLIMHHDIERGQYDPTWHPSVKASGAFGYIDDEDRFSLLGTYTVGNNVLGTGFAQTAGIEMTVLSFFCTFGIRTDAKQSYDCNVGFRTSINSISNAVKEVENRPCDCFADNMYLYAGATLRTETDQKNYAGFNTGLSYYLFSKPK